MKIRLGSARIALASISLLLFPLCAPGATSAVLGWNNLGMHCMDSDYSVFSILPPYNTIECQLIVGGKLVTNGTGYTVTYEAVADPDGSFNSTALGKGNYNTYVGALYGAHPPPEVGLAGWAMPGVSNIPQTMHFEVTNAPAPGAAAKVNWFRAEGIPITPYDDAHRKNPYPLMRMIARNAAQQPLATNDVVLPVSDEMDCRSCHASGTQATAQPAAGWVWDGLPERDYRLNILRRHDEHQFAAANALYTSALAARGFNPAGLYRSVTADGKPVLCAVCHASEALGTASYGSIPPLTASMHAYHAHVQDPVLTTTLDNASHRSACYRCHPGSSTRCLRGAMGGAIAADGSMEMQCQSCHGTMSQVGASNRTGWFMEPNCGSCHTGDAVNNAGLIRFTSVFTNNSGGVRVISNPLFASNPGTPAPQLSLYRFSSGHGGLQCSACHGSTHAEFPSTHRNDNLRNQALQGHAGVMAECTACHSAVPNTVNGGPHGMHPVGTNWVSTHPGLFDAGLATRAQCRVCHGTDYRGTVLSRAQADRSFSVFGGRSFFRGAIIGCYNCHNGPDSETANSSAAPTVANVITNTANDHALIIPVTVTGAGAVLKVISQPANGSVGVSSHTLTYYPAAGFVGTETFTYAAYDGAKNSSLGTATVSVTQGAVQIGAAAYVPPNYPAGMPVPFAVQPAVTNSAATPIFHWTFGDGSPGADGQFPTHTYAQTGSYTWSVVTQLSGKSATNSGTITLTAPITLKAVPAGGQMLTFSWPEASADLLLEQTAALGSQAQWTWVTNTPTHGGGIQTVTLQNTGTQFYRIRRPW